jgi:NAD-dependent SIR2 family protein deacetylase
MSQPADTQAQDTTMSTTSHDAQIRRAAEAIRAADALIIGAGAGMGIDSGLPTFRGEKGFWNAYPPYAALGLRFEELANPIWFATDPTLAWGFYGHRLMLYRRTRPHEGFAILRRWGERMRHGSFVFTSNVDGHFQAAGFDPDRIVEHHGTIHRMQCSRRCGIESFSADRYAIAIDEATMRAEAPLPDCPCCGALARPNILMFDDRDWDSTRTDEQVARLEAWLRRIGKSNLVVIECGAGGKLPRVRLTCEELATRFDGTLIRINPRESDVPVGQIGLSLGALDGLRAIDEQLSASRM